jgi:hypothetical protein
METRILGVVALMALIVLSGCTREVERIYDCSKCETDCSLCAVDCSLCAVDCSLCAVDCSKCAGQVTVEPVTVEAGVTMMVPTLCTEELCGTNEIRGWMEEVGLRAQLYDADWAQGVIVLMHMDQKASVLNPSTKRDLMKSICDFADITDACEIADAEFEKAKAGIKTCLADEGLTLGTVAFYYSSTCPYCTNMKPWVRNLEGKGYSFLWAQADSADPANMTIAYDCYSTILQFGQGVPQFACPANGAWQIGAFSSEEAMEKFAQDCADAAR